MKSLKDYIVETETKQVTEGILDWAKKIFTPKDPTPQTPITAADIDARMKDPAFVAQVQSAAAALNISPEQLVAQLKQQVVQAPALAAPAAPAPAATQGVTEADIEEGWKGAAAGAALGGAIGGPAGALIGGAAGHYVGNEWKDMWKRKEKSAAPAPAPAPVAESAEHDSSSTFEHICRTFKRDVKDFQTTGELSEHLYDALYDYYVDDMPYGTKKARDGDPYEWIGNRFYNDLDDQSDTGIAEMVRLAGLPTVQDEGIEDIPAFMRKGKPEVFPAPIMPRPDTKIKHSPVRPENIPAVHRSGPVSLDQIRDNSDKMSDLQTLRRMAGLPDRPEHGSPL